MIVADTQESQPPPQATSGGAVVASWQEIATPAAPFLKAVAHRLAEQVQEFIPEVVPLAQYAISNQGKQLRPLMVALAGNCAGRPSEPTVTAAVIIEMVHLATLVHDDVMDEAAVRRRQPTLAASWGNHVSILLGDCLFAHALKLASSYPTTDVCRAVSTATNTVCSGEILQTLRKSFFELSHAEYFRMVEMKTAELFALSCELGGGLCGSSPQERAALRDFGLQLGVAYQVYDDCIDLFGSETAAGKSLGTDLHCGKVTLPVLLARDQATPVHRQAMAEAFEQGLTSRLPVLRQLLEEYQALERTQDTIEAYLARARTAAFQLKDTPGRAGLIDLTNFLAQQTRAVGVSP